MKRLLASLIAALLAVAALPAAAQFTQSSTIFVTSPGSGGTGGVTIGAAIDGSCTSGYLLYNNAGVIGCLQAATVAGTPAAGDLSYWTSSSAQALFTPNGSLILGGSTSAPTNYAGSTITAGQFGTAIGNTGTLTGATLSAKNAQTSTYQVLAADFNSYKTITVASGTFTITLVASASQPADGKYIRVVNYGSGVVTIARSGQNINGGTTSLTLPAASATAPSGAFIMSDGTNYFAALYGGVSFPLLAPNGSAGAPSYSFSGATDAGIRLSGGNIVIENSGGNRVATLTTNQGALASGTSTVAGISDVNNGVSGFSFAVGASENLSILYNSKEYVRWNAGGHGNSVAQSGVNIPSMGACGTSPSVVGTDEVMLVTIGTGGVATSCAITFGTAFTTNAPVCVANSDTDIVGLKVAATTTTVTVSAVAAFTASSKLNILCRGRL